MGVFLAAPANLTAYQFSIIDSVSESPALNQETGVKFPEDGPSEEIRSVVANKKGWNFRIRIETIVGR